MSKRHNHRQRKKLHLGEYKELGFNVELQLIEGLTEAQRDALADRFIEEVIEPRGLMYGGSLSYGFVCLAVRGDTTEDDRAAVQAWLSPRPEIAAVTVSELVDAWH